MSDEVIITFAMTHKLGKFNHQFLKDLYQALKDDNDTQINQQCYNLYTQNGKFLSQPYQFFTVEILQPLIDDLIDVINQEQGFVDILPQEEVIQLPNLIQRIYDFAEEQTKLVFSSEENIRRIVFYEPEQDQSLQEKTISEKENILQDQYEQQKNEITNQIENLEEEKQVQIQFKNSEEQNQDQLNSTQITSQNSDQTNDNSLNSNTQLLDQLSFVSEENNNLINSDTELQPLINLSTSFNQHFLLEPIISERILPRKKKIIIIRIKKLKTQFKSKRTKRKFNKETNSGKRRKKKKKRSNIIQLILSKQPQSKKRKKIYFANTYYMSQTDQEKISQFILKQSPETQKELQELITKKYISLDSSSFRDFRAFFSFFKQVQQNDYGSIKVLSSFQLQTSIMKDYQKYLLDFMDKNPEQNYGKIKKKQREQKKKNLEKDLSSFVENTIPSKKLEDFSFQEQLPQIGNTNRSEKWELTIKDSQQISQLKNMIQDCQDLISNQQIQIVQKNIINLAAQLDDKLEFLCIISPRPILTRIVLSIFQNIELSLINDIIIEDQIAILIYDFFLPHDQLFIQTLEKLCDLSTRQEFNLEQAKLFSSPKEFFKSQWRKLIQYENGVFTLIFDFFAKLPIAMRYYLWFDLDTFKEKSSSLTRLPIKYLDYLVRTGYLERNIQLLNKKNIRRIASFQWQQDHKNILPDDWKVGQNDISMNELINTSISINDIESQSQSQLNRFIIWTTLDNISNKRLIREDNDEQKLKQETIQLLNQIRFTSEIIHRMYNFREEFKIYEEIVQLAKEKIKDFSPVPIIEYTISYQEIIFLDTIYQQQGKDVLMEDFKIQNPRIINMTVELNRSVKYKSLNRLENYVLQANQSRFQEFNSSVQTSIQLLQNLNSKYSQNLTSLIFFIQEFIFYSNQEDSYQSNTQLMNQQYQIIQKQLNIINVSQENLIDELRSQNQGIISQTRDKIIIMTSGLISTIITEMNQIKNLTLQKEDYQENIITVQKIFENSNEENQIQIAEKLTNLKYSKLLQQIIIKNVSQLFYTFIIPTFKQIQVLSDTIANLIIKEKMRSQLEQGLNLLPISVTQYNEIIEGIKEISKIDNANQQIKDVKIEYDIEMIE